MVVAETMDKPPSGLPGKNQWLSFRSTLENVKMQFWFCLKAVVFKMPQLVPCNLINPIKALSVFNRHLKFIPEFFKWFIRWQVQAIKAERTEDQVRTDSDAGDVTMVTTVPFVTCQEYVPSLLPEVTTGREVTGLPVQSYPHTPPLQVSGFFDCVSLQDAVF